MGSKELLRLSNLNKWYDGLHALQDVFLSITENEVVALVGDNGAGKSTLVKIVSGAETPDSGEIIIRGKTTKVGSPKDATKLGIAALHQSLGLVGSLNVFENIFLGQEETRIIGPIQILDKKKMRERAVELLNELAIDVPRLEIPVSSMSGGQRQCVAISRLLLDNVNLILMDEPMAALGVAEGKKVLDMIERLKEKGVSVLVISHNLEHVFSIADRIIVLKNGRLVDAVSPKHVSRTDVVKMITTGESLTSEESV
jgi:ABC-type sugar transport system ATPase subunit